MTFYIPNQNTVVAAIFCLGVFIAFLYDIFSIAGRIVNLPKIAVFINDLVFCLVSCVLFIAVIYITNYGYIRWYEIAFLLLGFGAYRVVFERHILMLAVKLVKALLKFLKLVIFLALTPVLLLLKLVRKFALAALKALGKVHRKQRLYRFSRKKLAVLLEDSKNGFV